MNSGAHSTEKNTDKNPNPSPSRSPNPSPTPNTDIKGDLEMIGSAVMVKKSPRKQLSERSNSEQVKITRNKINAYRDSNGSQSSPASKIRIDPADVNCSAFAHE